MGNTLQILRAQFYQCIEEAEDTSHFTASEANGLINQAIPLLGAKIHHPRDLVGVQVEENVGAYNIPTDALYTRTAYFGDVDIKGDVQPIKVYKEETLKEVFPSWLDRHADNAGRPNKLIILDRFTYYIHPFPNAEHSAAGKKLIVGYVYAPPKLNSDSSQPDLPPIYHDAIQFYAAGLAYIGKLANITRSIAMFKLFDNLIQDTAPAAEEEASETLRMQWGFQDE